MALTHTKPDAGDRARAELADLVDRQMEPLGLAAMEALAPTAGMTVLDVGCGAGATILQLLERVRPAGRVVGVDIAPGVLAVARRRTSGLPGVDLIQADAASLSLPTGSIDAAYSRLGVMAFAHPVAAFANLRRMLRPGGSMGFLCWRALRDNALDCLPLEAAGLSAAADQQPFSLEEASTIRSILQAAGFGRILVRAHDEPVSCGDLETTLAVVARVGALGKLVREDPDLWPSVEPRVRAALSARERGGLVYLGAATWIVTAAAI